MNHSQVLWEQQQKGRHQGSRQLLASSTFYGFSSLFLFVCLLHALLYGQACLWINFSIIPVFMGLLPIITLNLAFVLHDLWAQSPTVPHSLVLPEYQFWKCRRKMGLTQFCSYSSVFLRRHGSMDKITSQIVGESGKWKYWTILYFLALFVLPLVIFHFTHIINPSLSLGSFQLANKACSNLFCSL